MRVSVFEGDITDAPADAVCTSTNPRLSLMMGTGAAVRARGGFEVLRACEAIVAKATPLVGSVHATTAGALPFKIAIHCVASNEAHRSSPEIIAACVRNAVALAKASGCRSVAMPVFGAGHAHVKFAKAVETILETLQSLEGDIEVVLVNDDGERARELAAMCAAAQPLVPALTPGS